MTGSVHHSFGAEHPTFIAAGARSSDSASSPRQSQRRECACGLIFFLFVFAMSQALPAVATATDELEPIPESEKPKLLERIRLELAEYQASVDSIEVKWTERSLRDPRRLPKVMAFRRLLWTLSGRRQMLTTEAAMSAEDPVRARFVASFDGENCYLRAYHHSDPTKLNQVTILEGEQNQFAAIDIPWLTGWRIWTLEHESLSSMLAKGNSTLVGKRFVHGEPCYEVETRGFPAPQGAGVPYSIVTWIDPNHGWLPRRIRICPELAYRDPVEYARILSPKFGCWECQVTSFNEVLDTLHQKTVFFPKEAEIVHAHAITVNEVTINRFIDKSVFSFLIPDGVEVVEQRGNANVAKTITGSDEARAQHEQLIENDRIAAGIKQHQAAVSPGQSRTVIDARPNANSSLPKIMFAMSVMAFIAACGIAGAKRLRRHS